MDLTKLRVMYDRASDLHEELCAISDDQVTALEQLGDTLDELADALGIDEDDDGEGGAPAEVSDAPCDCRTTYPAKPAPERVPVPSGPRPIPAPSPVLEEAWRMWPYVPHFDDGRPAFWMVIPHPDSTCATC